MRRILTKFGFLGIVGHAFAIKDKDRIRSVSGFAQRFERETVWEKADLNNYKVLKVGDLTLHGKYTSHKNVDCLGQGAQTNNAQILRLIPSNKNQTDSVIQLMNVSGDHYFQFHEEYSDSIMVYQSSAPNYLYFKDQNNDSSDTWGRVEKDTWFEVTNDSSTRRKEAFR
ncbi:MAG: hypothetical protein AAFO07_26845, partial [Bacteroidota bacterium]